MEVVGSLSVPVRIDLGPLEREMADLKSRLSSVEGEMQKTTRQTNGMSTAMKRLGVVVGGTVAAFLGFNQVVSTLANFESSMASVGAITRASKDELAAMRDIAKELGATTEFSASQAADGLKFLGMAGFDAAQSIEAIPQVLDLATAAQMDLAASADITSNIMSAFQIAASEAGQVTDILAAASSRANTDVYQLGTAMKYAGPVAQSLGIEMSDAAAAIGKLSDAGIQGSQAGTGLRTILASLAKPTKEAQKALASMGLTVDAVNPKTSSLVEITKALRDGGLEASRAITIFGREGAAAALALTGSVDQLGKLSEELRDVDGAAKDMADTIRDTLRGDLNSLGSAVEGLIIAFGEGGLTGALRFTVQSLTSFVRVIAGVADRIIAYGTAAATVWGVTYVAGVIKAIGITNLFTASLVALRAILARLGIGLIIVGLGELIYRFTKLVENTGSAGQAFAALGEVASGVFEGIAISASAIPPALQAVWADIRADFMLLMRDLGLEWNKFLEIFEGPALTVTVGGKTFELLGGLDLSEFKASTNGAIASAAKLRNEAGALREEAGKIATEGFDKAKKSIEEFYKLTTARGEMQGPPPPPGGTGNGDDPWTPPELGGFDGGGGGKKKRDPYTRLIEQSTRYVQQQEIERQAIGMTALEAAKLRAEFDLLNQAEEAGIKLTDDQRDSLTALAHSMAEAEQSTKKLQEAYNFGKDVFKGFFSDFKNNLQNGMDLWTAFGNAAANALQKIADKALDMALNGIFDMIFGAFGGGGGGIGGIIGSILGHATGTRYSPGGWRMVGENGPELMNVPGGAQVIPNNRLTAPAPVSFGRGSGGVEKAREINIYVSGARGNAEIRQMVNEGVQEGLSEYDSHQLPQSLERVNANPRIR